MLSSLGSLAKHTWSRYGNSQQRFAPGPEVPVPSSSTTAAAPSHRTCVPIPSEGGSAPGELSDRDTRAEPCPGTRSRWHQKALLELQSKNTKSAFLNELQNLLQWFAPDKEVNNLLPGKERWGVKKERDDREERM